MKSDYYLKFENKFRGDQISIQEQFKKYDELVYLINNDLSHPTLVDIGCGRGEWLEKWSKNFDDCIGIENDSSMVDMCIKKGLKVIKGDAINMLSNIKDDSVSIISIFHMVEHIDHIKLLTLMTECHRVLRKEGILLIETPSIDNLIVSTKSFYLDPTHINPINPDSLLFLLKTIGFHQANDFYINGGPLQDDKHSKITRILNGVAQDLLVVATKSSDISKLIFETNKSWQSSLQLGIKTLDAAVDFDLSNEKTLSSFHQFNNYTHGQIQTINKKLLFLDQLNNELNLLNSEVNLLLNELKYLRLMLRTLKRLLHPFYRLTLVIKKIFMRLFTKLLTKLISYSCLRKILLSNKSIYLVNLILHKFPFAKSSVYFNTIKNRFDKYRKLDHHSQEFNNYLETHYRQSKSSQALSESFLNILRNKD